MAKPSGMKKIILFIIVIVVIGCAYYFYDKNNKQVVAPSLDSLNTEKDPESETAPTQEESIKANNKTEVGAETKTEITTKPVGGMYSSGEEDQPPAGPDILVTQVDYDGAKFTPDSIDIKQGDIIIFKNNSAQEFWPASNNHPTHTLYPEFDPQTPISAGGKWQFKFEKVGSWRYHDHLNASAGGTVNVSQR